MLLVGRIFIDPQYHQKGYGLEAMQQVEGLFPDVHSFNLDTPIWNVRTNRFYQKLGYKEQHRDKEFVYYQKRI